MPCVMCNWCQYIGQSVGEYRSPEEEWQDVEKHEKTCPEKPEEGHK